MKECQEVPKLNITNQFYDREKQLSSYTKDSWLYRTLSDIRMKSEWRNTQSSFLLSKFTSRTVNIS